MFLTAIGLTPGGSSTVHIYTQTVHRIQETEHHNNKRGAGCGLCPVFASYTLAFAWHLRKKHVKTSVRVVEKCSDIPVAVVRYTFTHKQYTEQPNWTEYTKRNIPYIEGPVRLIKLQLIILLRPFFFIKILSLAPFLLYLFSFRN
jgi:hypothetical protein